LSHALQDNGIEPQGVMAQVALSEYGERMHLSVMLPMTYSLNPGDGHLVGMRLECVNSVEASTRFQLFVGWFRFVCSNGLVLDVKETNFQHRHNRYLSITDINAALAKGIGHQDAEKGVLEKWQACSMKPDDLAPWINESVMKTWGFKAAVRTYHIARTGHDVEMAGPYQDEWPTTIPVRTVRKVPGAPPEAGNGYDVCQILAWLAKERRDLQERLEWRQQIPGLMRALLK
jgi:hypothetical protein